MNSDLQTFINMVLVAKTKEELKSARLKLIEYISSLGRSYAANLQLFSDAVIRNKEEWYKKSMIECIHQAGREVGYTHETNKIEIEAARALLAFICDMEVDYQDESDEQEPETDTSPSTT